MSDSALNSLASIALDMAKEDDTSGSDSSEMMIIPRKPVSLKKRKVSLKKSRDDPFVSHEGGDFTPHCFIVNPGEDVIRRIMYFTENGSRGISVLSANGAVCNFKIQSLSYEGGVLNFEDTFELISLSSSMVKTQSRGVRNESGGWRIAFGGVNGSFYAGFLVGELVAASHVQVVIGSFWPMIENLSENRIEEFKSVFTN